METLHTQRTINTNDLFDDHFLDTRIVYVDHFHKLPSVNYMSQLDGERAYNVFREKFSDLVLHIHQYKWFRQKSKKFQFGCTVVILTNNCIVEFDDCYCEILHDGNNEGFLNEMMILLKQFREKKKREPQEINLVVQNGRSLELRSMEIKRTRLNLGLFYEDDFIEVDEIIRKRLRKKHDRGIVLLHGLPGTGKTTYLRHLVSSIKKRILFLSPSAAGHLVSPEFIQLLIDNPETVMIIEDAENIIMDRKLGSSSAVSNLLNLSDGLLADCLNIQLICTFNSPLTVVDSALMRKGRLIARYEFGKLGVAKSQQLSNHFGFDTEITTPMTIAELANQHEQDGSDEKTEVIGFRIGETMMN